MPASLPSPPESAVPHVRVDITDELDLAGLPEVAHVLDRILALRPRELTVDLAGCRHVDAAAVALLLDVHRRLARQGGLLTLSNPHPRIRRILENSGLGAVPVVDTPRPAARGRARVASASR
ncbi:STAS domain-containing protein [Micromonospora tulbaghiae]|uniref:STAS domain-containing protein n=1 Tax=Micromonospora tulbaghiae TaxID=479978 RepID=A0AAW4JQD4_9ACTN|nr:MULTISPECIES: STAS domain-containing protein [Micromonospora]KAB1903881.1 STAS domain-containing protein [Micromonospora sp. AMSO1212t]MBO4143704.1 STAS domain-containing protein [Micromonospora tulbaghiae]MDX5461106.1 STAS domain-containing protein [Micromonospora tulbaghiae]